MLRGHVDLVTRDLVAGWAADDERPGEIVQVSIFVNGRKTGQAACDLNRPDLVHVGALVGGLHGFNYVFPQRLNDEDEKRVSVRHATTGRLLNNGDVLFRKDNNITIRMPRADQADGEPDQLPVPQDPRWLFEALALYDPRSGLFDLLAKMQFSAETPRQIRYSVFGGYGGGASRPTQLSEIDQLGGYAPRDYMNELLLSQEFQKELIPMFLGAYPEKKRLFFIHIPKCAGTDLSVNLMRRFPSMHQTLTEERWTSKEVLFKRVSRLALQARILRHHIFVRT